MGFSQGWQGSSKGLPEGRAIIAFMKEKQQNNLFVIEC